MLTTVSISVHICYILIMKRTTVAVFKSLRFRSWIKNVFVFAGILFAGLWSNPEAIRITLLATLGFCLLSSAVYLINDVADRNSDVLHPEKKLRPIAAGDLSTTIAIVLAVIISSTVLTLSWLFAPQFALVLSMYLLMQITYSLKLKHVVLLDVVIIAIGFVLRALAGVMVCMDFNFKISISHWLLVCTFFIAVFLAFAKRRYELVTLGEKAEGHRRNLREYSAELLDSMMGITASASLIGYSIYTVSPRTLEEVSTKLWITIPFVAYGIFRYLYLVHVQGHGGSPDKLLLSDKPLLLNILLWMVSVSMLLHFFPGGNG